MVPRNGGAARGRDDGYRGHAGIRQLVHDMDDASRWSSSSSTSTAILATACWRWRGFALEGGRVDIETVSPVAYLMDRKDGKAVRVRTYMDAAEAIEAANSSA